MVTPSPVATQLNCTQCGGELHPDEGQIFLTCTFCGSTVYLDKSRVVFHWAIAPTMNEQDAAAALYRWMSGSQTVKDLDKKARVVGQSFQYFPLWYFKWAAEKGEQEALQPAAATAVTELSRLRLPAGDMKPYASSLDALAVAPTVPLDTALEWLRESSAGAPALPAPSGRAASNASGMREMAVVHVPLHFFKYDFAGETFTAVVDAASGTVLANIFPAKQETPYRLVGGVTALVYLCLATFPLFGMAIGSETGVSMGLALCAGLGLLAAPALFAWAYWVASKV
jgi:hypothetical protein